MFHISLLTLLATKVLASPLPTSESISIPRSPAGIPSYTSACEAADNCETYTDPSSGRVNIRFKSGMEPGTEHYNTRVANSYTKRDSSNTTTTITVGDSTIFWGCDIDPVATLGNLINVCPSSGSCLSDEPYTDQVTYVTPGQDTSSSESLSITAVGTYPPWMRNGLVEGVQAVMSAQGVITTQTANYLVVTGAIGKNGGQSQGASCQIATAPTFIGLGVYLNGLLQASFQVTASVGTPGSGFCANGLASTSALTGAIAGALGPIGAGVAAIFGIISASCTP